MSVFAGELCQKEGKKGDRKMKRLLLPIVFAMILVLLSTGAVLGANSYEATLVLDGELVESDVPPLLVQDEETGNWRTIVPLRAVFEGMGGDVTWDGTARIATVTLGNTMVQLAIDSKTAFVNGVQKELDVPAQIIDNRTMIPLRFVGEALQCGVEWDNATRTVYITSPEELPYTGVYSITMQENETLYRVEILADSMITGIRNFAYEEPERYGVDLNASKLLIDTGKINADNNIFSAIRFAQFDEETVRVVLDLNEKVAGRITLSEDRTALYIDFPKDPSQIGPVAPVVPDSGNMGNVGVVDPSIGDGTYIPGQDAPEGTVIPDQDIPGETVNPGENPGDDVVNRGDSDREVPTLPLLDWRAAGKLIVIDPGHGGNDVGAIGVMPDGTKIYEKDLNLPIALRLYELLQSAGANVTMLRMDDSTISLYERPEMANLMGADLYVAVHNNSSEKPTPNGTEVLYYNKEWEAGYGYTSKDVAKEVYQQLIYHIGLAGRDYQSNPKLAVLNKTMMPAIIIEGAFISNASDLAVMVTDEYKENYAVGAATGIINVLNASVKDQ